MRQVDESFISSGIKNAQKNTWGNKYLNAIPDIHKEGSVITLAVNNKVATIDSFDEIILTIILKFLFMPVWFIKQCYNTKILVSVDTAENKINSWVQTGLIWIESSVTGSYVRPTYALFNLFGENPYQYSAIPFSLLTHTICEEKIMFEVMSGISEINKKEKDILLPRFSELGFDLENEDQVDISLLDESIQTKSTIKKLGTNILAEEDFRNPNMYSVEGIRELSDVENKINQGIKNKAQITPELENFRNFVLVKKLNNTGVVKKDYAFHVPDLIIPCLRVNGMPRSIAIEVELSNKRAINYVETLTRYKNNNKYGSVYWLCNTPNISNALRQAYDEIGGTGTCKTVLMEFIIPSPDEF